MQSPIAELGATFDQAIGEWNASNDQKIYGLLWYTYQHCGQGCSDQFENSLARTDPGAGMLPTARNDFSWVTANTNIVPGTPGSSLKFQAENCTNSETGNGMGTSSGAPNVDYYDTTNGNSGGEYRIEPGDSVDILRLPTWDGFAVGYTAAGEWLRYETLAGGFSYKFRVRYSRGAPGTSRVRLVVDGQSKSTLTLTGSDWNVYQEAVGSEVITLPRGKHDIRIYFDDGLVNLDWFRLDRI